MPSQESIDREHARNREYMRNVRRRDPEAHRAYMKEWRKNNKDKISKWPSRIRMREKCRDEKYKYNYGLSTVKVNEMADSQKWLCALCESPLQTTGYLKFVVDHDHKTGKVRGLLCKKCNLGLGYFNDNPDLFNKAAAYIERTK